jgi:hypothetical protein
MRVIQSPGQVTQVVIVPNVPAEIVAPLRLNNKGGVAFTTDPAVRARQHILAIAMTTPGERVMRPTYGAGLQQLTFQSNPAMFGVALQRLQQALQVTEGGFTVTDVAFKNSGQSPGTVLFQVTFTVDNDPTQHQALFDFNGHFVGTT